MPEEPETIGSIVVAEVGSSTTRVLLLDMVEGESRLICQVEKPSTVELPFEDATVGIIQAVYDISKRVGRTLLTEDGQLLMPQNKELDGINNLVVSSSVSGTLGIIITAIASNVSAHSSLNACRSTYSSILQVVTLDDYDKNRELGSGKTTTDAKTPQESVSLAATSWIERQVQTMLALTPDVVVIAGGLEGGASDSLKRLAHIVALTTLRISVDASGQHLEQQTTHPVIYAGNSEVADEVRNVLADRAEVIVVDNLRPSLEQERLDPTRKELDRIYHEHVLPNLPGYGNLQALCKTPITTVYHATGLMTRFIAERYQRNILTIDVGSTSSSAFLANPGAYTPIVLGTSGVGYGITTVLKERGVANMMRWLPFPMSAKDMLHWLLNKLVRPHLIPTSREELFLEHAVTREILIMLRDVLNDQHPDTPYDMVFAGGGVLSHAPLGLAALTILDALQPTAQESLLDIYLDPLGFIPACGALAALEPDASVTLFDRDVLQNAPLATCVVALGDGKVGKPALEVELTPVRGKPQQLTVKHGEIAHIPLEPGRKASLSIQPTSGVRIGNNAPGAKAESGVVEISGSHLGIVIDARGRPLKLPENDQKRREKLWEWMAALGVVEGESPYLDAPPATDKKATEQEAELEIELPEDAPTPAEIAGRAAAANAGGDETQQAAEAAVAAVEGAGEEEPQKPKSKRQLAQEAKQKAKEEKQRAKEEKQRAKEEKKQAGSKEKKGKPSKADKKGKATNQAAGEAEVVEEGAKAGGRISLTDLDLPPEDTQQPTPEPGSLDSDLASLRQTVAGPEETQGKKGKAKGKKKGGGGLFGGKKK
jgi:hypothetical protein